MVVVVLRFAQRGQAGMRHVIEEFRQRLSSAIVYLLTCHIVGMDGRFNIVWKARSHQRFDDEVKASLGH